jgi:hypothetical protein
MASISVDAKFLQFSFAIIFAILGAILLAVALFDPTTSADRTAMGCTGISMTAIAITLVAVMNRT